MKILRIILTIVLICLAIYFIGGMMLPKTYSISRSIMIKAPDSTVYMNVANFHNFLKWNPWTKYEPSAKVTISGEPAQAGHLWEWAGKETGMGQMEIQEVHPYSLVAYELSFIEPFQSSANTTFTFENTPEGTRVVWGMSGTAKSTGDRWMGMAMDKMMDKDFTNGLHSLKELSEK